MDVDEQAEEAVTARETALIEADGRGCADLEAHAARAVEAETVAARLCCGSRGGRVESASVVWMKIGAFTPGAGGRALSFPHL
jgi:hypothetical protein